MATSPPLSGRGLRTLRRHLDHLFECYDYAAHRERDPIRFVLAHEDPADQEVVGLVAACLAYGRVDRVLFSIAEVLRRTTASPARFAREFDPRGRAERRAFQGFLHRMTAGVEMHALFSAIGALLREHGGLERVFAQSLPASSRSVKPGLEALVHQLRSHAFAAARAPLGTRRLRFLLPSPAEGSACKRLNMWLRWMVRHQQGLDLGLWRSARPAQLIIPLDAHVIRLASFFGLTTRATPDWRMAEEVTASLRRLDPDDPVKYDFALSHIGMSGAWLPAV